MSIKTWKQCFQGTPKVLNVCYFFTRSGVVVSSLASMNEVNQRRTRLVVRWATVSGFTSRYRTFLFRYVNNQPPKANSAFHPSGVGKLVPASAGKAKAGMVHSVSGWTRGVQVKLWDPLRTRAIYTWAPVHDVAIYKCTFTLPYLAFTEIICKQINKSLSRNPLPSPLIDWARFNVSPNTL